MLEERFAGTDDGGYAELAGPDRHVGIRASVLSDEAADAAREDPVEAGIRTRHEKNCPAKLSGGSPTEATAAVTLLLVIKVG